MPRVTGFLRVLNTPGQRPDNSLPGMEGPVDPGYDIGMERPDNSLPGNGPVDPGYGIPLPPVINNSLPSHDYISTQPVPPTYPIDPSYGIPTRPGIWPQPPRPPHMHNPIRLIPVLPSHPIYELPERPDRPDNSLPITPPGGSVSHPIAPGGERPSGQPVPPPQSGRPDQGLPQPPGSVSQPIYLPGTVWPPLPPTMDDGKYLCFTWIVGIGYRWIVIDTNLSVTNPIGPGGEYPSQGLPPNQNYPSQGLPNAPARPSQGLPPTSEPKK